MVNITRPVAAIAAISIFSSLIVVLTPICFVSMRDKLFLRIVTYISVGDIIGNFPYLFPYRNHGNWWCTLQGLMNFCGYPQEWLWTAALVYLLYELAVRNEVPENLWNLHVICWLLPVLLSCLILTIAPIVPNDNPNETCSVEINSVGDLVYHEVSYYGLYILSLVYMFVLYGRFLYFQREHPPANPLQKATLEVTRMALQCYPGLMIVFWFPHMITSVAQLKLSLELYDAFMIWKILHGLATSIAFFYQSKESRRLWWIQVLCPVLCAVGLGSCLGAEDPRLLDDRFGSFDCPIVDIDDLLGSSSRTVSPDRRTTMTQGGPDLVATTHRNSEVAMSSMHRSGPLFGLFRVTESSAGSSGVSGNNSNSNRS